MSRADDENDGQATERVVIRNKRKIDPDGEAVEGAVSKDEERAQEDSAAAEPAAEQATGPEPAPDGDEEPGKPGAAAEQTTGAVLLALLPVLDDLDRAREHGDLVGPFATVAESLTAVTGKLGLVAFGEKGDPFDPTRHEAVTHQTSADVTESTWVEVMRRGYTLGERLLRPALVAVADPE
jgi:molecular chaperone GrpE